MKLTSQITEMVSAKITQGRPVLCLESSIIKYVILIKETLIIISIMSFPEIQRNVIKFMYKTYIQIFNFGNKRPF